MVAGLGLLEAVGSAAFNGTFGTFSRVKRVEEAKVPFPVFNFWVSVGIVLSSLPLLAISPHVFTPWGLVSGLLFVLSMANTFFAIGRLGLGTAAGIWCGVALLTSFTWGVRVQGEVIASPGLAAPGLMLLVAGLVAIAVNGQVASTRRDQETTDEELISVEQERSADAEAGNSAPRRSPVRRGILLGLTAAIAAGLFGGLVLAPMHFAPEEAKGVQYIPSMAVGVLISAPFVTAAIMALSHCPWSLCTKAAAAPGIAAGIFWNCGNALSILATQDPDVGLSVAYPIMQCGFFVAGIWGIFLFKELVGREQIFFWIGGAILISGATMLASSK